MKLRPYQERVVDATRRKWIEGERRVLGVMPTGAGKTETAIELVKAEATPTTRALIVVGLKQLCRQWVERLRKHGIDHVGVLQGENTTATYASVLVATVQTLRSRGIPKGVGLVIIDESHIWHEAHDKVLDAVGDARVLGLTATPLRMGLGERFDTMVVGATIRQLIADGFLVPGRYYAPQQQAIEAALEQVSILGGDFKADELSTAMRNKVIVADVVGTWQRLGENRQTIAFCVDKAHARDLAAELVAVGVPAEVVVDDTPDADRARIFASFDQLQTRVLCSVNVLSIGFDSPIASCAILARPTTSLSMHVQQGGRVLRPFDGKRDALILDHAGNTVRHGLLEEFVPPADLSMVDARSDKKKRKEVSDVWICRHCQAVNSKVDDECVQCGTARKRLSTVVVVDGQLIPIQYEPGEQLPGPTLDQVQGAYLMHRYHGTGCHMRNADGWAWYATQRRFKIPPERAKSLIPWNWRSLPTIPPDAETARWLRADQQRQWLIAKWRKDKEMADV